MPWDEGGGHCGAASLDLVGTQAPLSQQMLQNPHSAGMDTQPPQILRDGMR